MEVVAGFFVLSLICYLMREYPLSPRRDRAEPKRITERQPVMPHGVGDDDTESDK